MKPPQTMSPTECQILLFSEVCVSGRTFCYHQDRTDSRSICSEWLKICFTFDRSSPFRLTQNAIYKAYTEYHKATRCPCLPMDTPGFVNLLFSQNRGIVSQQYGQEFLIT